MTAGVAARENLEELLDQSKKAEDEVNLLRAENQALTAELADEKAKNEKLKRFESVAENPPKVIMVYIKDQRLCEKLIGTSVQIHDNALGNPEYSPDEQTRKRARDNVRDIVVACCKFGLERFADVHAQYLSFR